MRRLLSIVLLALTGCSNGCAEGPSYATVTLKGKEVQVEWARTDPDRRYAPVQHSALVDSRGILVGFPYDRHLHLFSLQSDGGYDVLFLSADGRILERQYLRANSEEGVTSKVEARYALLLAEGWCARQNVGDADVVELSGAVRNNPPEPMPEIKLGGVPLKVEVNYAQRERSRGFMHRRAISPEDGMLFAFRKEDHRSFWMLNCHIALDIAHFDKDGAFINLVSMDPYRDPRTDAGLRAPSSRDAQFVVETRKGWFRAKGLVGEDGKPTRAFRLEMPPAVKELVRKAE